MSHPQTTIIIVNDIDLDRKVIRLSLEKSGLENLNIVEASNGGDALILLSKNTAQLVISDVLMPEMNGLVLLEHIKKLYPIIPVLFLTASATESHIQKAVKLGADGILQSPYRITELQRKVRCLLKM